MIVDTSQVGMVRGEVVAEGGTNDYNQEAPRL